MYDHPRPMQPGPTTVTEASAMSKPHYLSDIPGTPPPRAEIAAVLSEQETATLALMEAVEALSIKMTPALAPSAPANQTGAGRPPTVTSLSGCIADNTLRIYQVAERVRDLRERLAL